MIRLDKIGASNHIVSVKIAEELKAGNVVKLTGLATGEREIYDAVKPTAITDKVVLLTTPFFPYDEKEDEEKAVLNSGSINRAHYLKSGDVITVTEDLVEGEATKKQFVEVEANKAKLKAVSSITETVSLAFVVDDIEESVPEFYGKKGIVLRVV